MPPAAEEIGWTISLLDPLEGRWGVLGASLVLGIVGWRACGPVRQAGYGARWIVAQCTVAVLLRILLVWVHMRSGRALSTAVVVHYDPTVTATVQGCWSRLRTTVPAMRS